MGSSTTTLFQPPPRGNLPGTGRAQPAASSQERQRFQVALTPENRAHLARQGKEVGEKVDQFTGWAQRTGDWFQQNVPGVRRLSEISAKAGDLAGEWGMRGALAVGADKWKVPDKVLDVADKVTAPVLQDPVLMNSLATQERFSYGAGMQALGMVEGVHTLATRPGEVAQGLKQAALHPIQTGKGIGGAVKDAWNKDPVEFGGRAAFEIGSLVLPATKAGTAAKAGEAVSTVGRASTVARGVEGAAQVASGVRNAARAADGVQGAARVASGVERAGGALRRGTGGFDELARQTAAKEDLARRLRGTLEGHNEVPPQRIRAEIDKLETEASVNRSKMAMAEPPVRPSTAELTEVAGKDAAKLPSQAFSERALGYPEDLSQKFKPAEIESMRVYLGNEVRGDPLNKAQRFVQSDLHDALDDLSKGFKAANGDVVPPGDVTRLNFKHFNGHLRGTRTDLTPGQMERIDLMVKHMDAAMEKSVLKEPATVYRVNEAKFTTPGADGLIPPDKAFQSTARTPQLGFATEEPGKYTLQIIELDKGQKVFDMDALTRLHGDLDSFRGRMPEGVAGKSPFGEQELLLPRGTQFKVADQWVDPVSGFNVQRVKVH